MQAVKYLWALRALLYKFIFKRIGFMSYIGPPLFLLGVNKVDIGNKVRIYPGLRIEVHGDGGNIIIGDNVSIGQHVHITASGQNLLIGKNTTILGNVFITNIDHDYKEIGKHIMEQDFLIQRTQIGENCFIGYGAAIQAGTILGKQCVIGANSVVRGVYPDYCVIVGAPAKVVKRFNKGTNQWERV